MTENIFISPQDFYYPVSIPLSMGIGGDFYPLMDRATALHEASAAISKNFGGKRFNCLWAIYRDGDFETQSKEFKKMCDGKSIPTREQYETIRSLSDLTNEEIKRANKMLACVEDLFLDGSICVSDVVCFSAHGYGENIRGEALKLLHEKKISEAEYEKFRDIGLMIAQEFKAEAMRKWLKLYDHNIPVY